jgi:hypothetical protein
VHALRLRASAKVPRGQAVQSELTLVFEKNPVSQSEQMDCAAAENVPTPQGLQVMACATPP